MRVRGSVGFKCLPSNTTRLITMIGVWTGMTRYLAVRTAMLFLFFSFLERLNPPPPKPEKVRSPTRESPNKLHAEGARGKRASLTPRPKQGQLAPPVSSSRALSPGRRGSRIRSQSVQLAQAPLSASFNAARRAR